MSKVDLEVYLEKNDPNAEKQNPEEKGKIPIFKRIWGPGLYVANNGEMLNSCFLLEIHIKGDPIKEVTLEARDAKYTVPLMGGIGRIEIPPDMWLVVRDLTFFA